MVAVVDSPAEETYRDVAKLIYQLCWKFASKGSNFDDCLGVANLAFVNAYHTYDSSRGSQFSTWLYHCVFHSLQDHIAKEQSYQRRTTTVDQVECDVEDNRCRRLLGVLAELSDDARVVVQTILESPQELAEVLRYRKPQKLRRGVWQHFRELGWSIGRTAECFEDIREALM